MITKHLKKLSQFPFFLGWEEEERFHSITVVFTGTIRLFTDFNPIKSSIIVLDSFYYSSDSELSLNKEGILSLFKEHLWDGPESIQSFYQYEEIEAF